jgi:methionyl-tRNA formyltransferase
VDTPPRIVFMGSKAAGLALCALLCEQPDLPTPSLVLCPDDSADDRSCFDDFESLCARHGVPLRRVGSAAEAVAALAPVGRALVLVHGWYRLIPIADCPQAEFYGFHYSALPAYRGNAPLVWQILRGEPRLGVSFFRFGAGIDDGDVVDQRLFDLGPHETIADALARAEAACMDVAGACLNALIAGKIALRPQPAAGASYCGLRIPDDGRIDWTDTAWRVHDFVRAQTRPYPGAFTELADGRRLRIWRSAPDPRRFYGVTGAVVAVEGPSVLVACGGDSAMRILACGLDGCGDAPPASLIGSLRTRLGRADPSGGRGAGVHAAPDR